MHNRTPAVSPIEEQLARILASPQFAKSPRLQSLLRFVLELAVAGKADQIKESTIAVEVFGRADTAGDSLVRSAVGRMRARLGEYYQETGAGDSIEIVIPKGRYVPEILHRSASVRKPSDIAVPRRRWRPAVAAGGAVVVLAAGSALLWNGPARASRANGEVQELYLKGRYYWNKRTPEDLNRALDSFTQAVVKDPRYAQAYVGLADTYNLLSEYTVMPYQEGFKRAMAAANTAIELNGKLPEAHNSLAYSLFYGLWDAAGAEREFRRAIELNPNYSTAHHWYATFLMSAGREQEALEQIGQAQALEPSSQSILADKGLILFWAGQTSAARLLLEELAAAAPQFVSPHRYLANLYLVEKQYPRALAEWRKDAALAQNASMLAVTKAGEAGFQANGARGMFQEILRAQQEATPDGSTRYFWLAQMNAVGGNRQEAMRYLELAFARHDAGMVTIAADPLLASLRQERGFQDLVKRSGISQPGIGNAAAVLTKLLW